MSSDPLLDQLQHYVSNGLPTQLPKFVAFIVGTNPSSGARSPKLWNAAFAACGIDGVMYPLDVDSANVPTVLQLLEQDSRVIAVAVAAPHKSLIAKAYVGYLSPISEVSESVNLLYRAKDMKFSGENTDGLAALLSLSQAQMISPSQEILVLGCGATGRSVLSALLTLVEAQRICVAVRGDSAQKWLSDNGLQTIKFENLEHNCTQVKLVINCTTVGWGTDAGRSPLSEKAISQLRDSCSVFDVIYQPEITELCRLAKLRGLRTLGGNEMNFLQAVLAFSLANPTADQTRVIAAMKSML